MGFEQVWAFEQKWAAIEESKPAGAASTSLSGGG
jgi:hypothetical protein